MKEVRDFDQYYACVDGTGRLTLRNRQFLRICPGISESKTQQDSAILPSEPPQEVPQQHHTVPPNPDPFNNSTQQQQQLSDEPSPPQKILNIDTPQQQRLDEPVPLPDTPTIDTPHQQHLNEPSSPIPKNSQITSETVQNNEPVKLRRSERVKKSTQFYNADDGTDGPANE